MMARLILSFICLAGYFITITMFSVLKTDLLQMDVPGLVVSVIIIQQKSAVNVSELSFELTFIKPL